MEYKDLMFEVNTTVGKIERKKNGFNLFLSMFNWYNEKYLHSSFISMMLSLDERYLKLFIEEIKKNDDKGNFCVEDFCKCDVFPNINDHAEKLNIDILITSKTTNKVIIIENKTFAKDRIVDGNPQLLGYGKKIIESAEFKNIRDEKDIYYVYLSLRGVFPSEKEEFKDKNLITISYDVNIRNWIKKCSGLETDGFKKSLMQQYLDMIDFALPDIKDILYLKRLVAGNLDELFRMYTSNENKDASFKDAMKHVMWHTIDDFITDLINKMKCIEGITFNIPVSNGEYQINKTDLHQKITRMAHIHTGKADVQFNYKGESYNICFSSKGIELSIVGGKSKMIDDLSGINFCNFECRETFDMINKDEANIEIEKVIDKIKSKLNITE
ncbi:PD-(D/E)XK nuclease family protein [uncultured Prevotella sp.]|uniref:PD-(D/E)XK nuclease family protein n=1 Tax=uncultured Prevotella sp. TaxID=159272 RepID=UPI00265CCD70|nr:PD-(D/E)XK nuclease family protein [uncultured Prevotella sp.]